MPLKIATFNTNSVRTRLPIILDWLKKESPDVLCLQETKVQDKDFPEEPFESAGYHVGFKGQKSYNGVAIISRTPLMDIKTHFCDPPQPEARFISATIHGIAIVNVYVPQGFAVGSDKFSYKLKWLGDLIGFISKAYDAQTPLILAGDFNVALEPKDVYDPKGLAGAVGFHPEEQVLMNKLFDWGLVDVFRKHEPGEGQYTFWDYRIPNGLKRNMGWRIDYILVTQPLAASSRAAWIDREPRALPKPSDHTFLIAEL